MKSRLSSVVLNLSQYIAFILLGYVLSSAVHSNPLMDLIDPVLRFWSEELVMIGLFVVILGLEIAKGNSLEFSREGDSKPEEKEKGGDNNNEH